METNTIHYTCICGRGWKHAYRVEIQGKIIQLSRIVTPETPPNDALCTCGKLAEAGLETPMEGYKWVRVRLLARVNEVSEQRYEELVQHFIEQEEPFNWDQIEAIEAKAARLADLGLTAISWVALCVEQQTEILKRQP